MMILLVFIWFVVIGVQDLLCDGIKEMHGVSPPEVLVVIRNMPHNESIKKAEGIKNSLKQDAEKLNQGDVEVLMLHENWAPYGAWTVLPIFEKLYSDFNSTKQWIYFCEDTTKLYLKGLLRVLSKHNSSKDWFLGHALSDPEPVIIHHYHMGEFYFPDFDAGWAISMSLLNKAVERLKSNAPRLGFSIDVKHEVAKFLHEVGTSLTNVKEFCVNNPLKKNSCVSTVEYNEPDCGLVDPDDVVISVKTCKKFHGDRMPIIKKTIGSQAKHIRYYSDVADKNIPTEYIGVQNTERGHCQKLYNIIERATKNELRDKKWLVIIDDDTIMSYYRLRKLLACYNPNDVILMGERYGYGINYKQQGYEYPTGGGGMVLSRAAINKMFEMKCRCPSADTPDDMWLGMCFRRHGPIIHTNSFHQTTPQQYNRKFLSHRYLVSFHKHQRIDPMEVYKNYVQDDKEKNEKKKDEL